MGLSYSVEEEKKMIMNDDVDRSSLGHIKCVAMNFPFRNEKSH
jgi:hypothetical protein